MYVTSRNRLTPRLTECKISYLMHLVMLFNIKYTYVCRIPKRFGMEQAITQIAVIILSDNSTGFDEMR